MTKRIRGIYGFAGLCADSRHFPCTGHHKFHYRPLGRLQQTAERLGKGDLDAKADLGSLEEINVLARTFNHMSERIRRLLEKNTQEQKNLREAELRLHQEQISPHFLYNTLDSIVWMAEGGNNRQVVEMTTDLSDFFRTVLSGGKILLQWRKKSLIYAVI